MEHKVKIRVTKRDKNIDLLETKRLKLPHHIARFLFGEFCDVLVMSPGKSIAGIEICEVESEGNKNGKHNKG